MSRLQDKAKPILAPLIRGEWTDLAAEAQTTLAAWATMFTMVAEFSDLNTLVTPFEHRDRFRVTRVPPEGWAVWIGAYSGIFWRSGFNHFGWSSGHAVAPSAAAALPHKPDTQSTGFLVGGAFFQTFSTLRPGIKVDELAYAKRFGLRCIWPILDDPVVRPDHPIDDFVADRATSALQPWPPETVRRAWES